MCCLHTLNMDASCCYMRALQVHNVSYPKWLHSSFTSTTGRIPDLIIVLVCPKFMPSLLVLWEETTSTFYFNITGACLMCLNRLLSASGRIIVKSWISNQFPCKTEKSVYVSCLLTVWYGASEHILTEVQLSVSWTFAKTMWSIISLARVCSCNARTK
jgi:hypothetical protein